MPKTKNSLSMESSTRKITIKNGTITYKLKLDGVEDYLTYNPTLLSILKMDRLKPFRDEGRLRFKIRKNGTDINYYLYDLAFACYSGGVNCNSFIGDMQRYYADKSRQRLSIDHADNNIHNNTILNLSLMPKVENFRKSDIVARIKQPIYLNSAYCNGQYRIQMLFELPSRVIKDVIANKFIGKTAEYSNGYSALHFVCDTPKQYVDCLKWLTEQSYEWTEPLKNARGQWIKNENNCWCADISHSLHAQSALGTLPDNLFQPFNEREV